MKVGNSTIEQLSEGFFELFGDGTFQKMESSRLDNLKDDPNIGKFTSAIGIDPLLIQKGDQNILVDPGLGWGLDSGSHYAVRLPRRPRRGRLRSRASRRRALHASALRSCGGYIVRLR